VFPSGIKTEILSENPSTKKIFLKQWKNCIESIVKTSNAKKQFQNYFRGYFLMHMFILNALKLTISLSVKYPINFFSYKSCHQ
jgi:hypothetical protein